MEEVLQAELPFQRDCTAYEQITINGSVGAKETRYFWPFQRHFLIVSVQESVQLQKLYVAIGRFNQQWSHVDDPQFQLDARMHIFGCKVSKKDWLGISLGRDVRLDICFRDNCTVRRHRGYLRPVTVDLLK